ncbi:hypothetical protein Zmor_004349 [Zophobas morio]|uniref:MOB kinase activator-like 2 n=1 Tax=Zophobas morio TaxID=2755281 RepID=A0AA38HPB2_9CUCU|nr:hypothetical protein Zmor_004349 [Zophobas morio]
MLFRLGKKKSQEVAPQPWMEEPYFSTFIKQGIVWSELVKPPYGVTQHEWLATNTRPFFNHINLIIAALSGSCTEQRCPSVPAGPRIEYFWLDGKGKKLKRLSAPQYFDYMDSFITEQLNNETLFPTKHGNPFPKDFIAICKKIYRLLFTAFTHVYLNHFEEVAALKLVAHLNTIFAHFIHFVDAYSLLDSKDYTTLDSYRCKILNLK